MKAKPVNASWVYSSLLQRLARSCQPRAVLFVLLVSCFAFSSPARTQTTDCAKLLDQAEDEYYQGHFDQAIGIAENCLTQRDLPENLEIRAHKIIAKASVSKRHVDRAKAELRKIIEIDPKITLDPDIEPPQIITLFEEVRREKKQEVAQKPQPEPVRKPAPETVKREEKKEKGWFARNWYFVAGGVAAAGLGAAVLGGGGGNVPPQPLPGLPRPPDYP